MKIVITTGLNTGDIGGPAQYGPRLRDVFIEQKHEVRIISYGFEKKLPTGIRHLCFFFKILPSVLWANKIIALDNFSVGVPSVLAAKLFRKKIIIRIGGDFLWEAYVARTNAMIPLTKFNDSMPELILKEKIILSLTKYLTRNSDKLAFNSAWQKKIWEESYKIPSTKTCVIRNYIPAKEEGEIPNEINFVWAGRDTPVKNLIGLREVMEEIRKNHNDVNLNLITNEPYIHVLNKLKKCYCTILPSISDVSPNFILEGASYGKPFIVTRESGISEILPKGGIFINPLDNSDLEKAILTMLESEVYNKYHREIESEYKSRSWKEVGQDFLNA